jgi:cation diffusion facilitator family transporter
MKERLQRGLHATLVGMAANVVLASLKLAAGLLGHSHALVADGVESFADLLSSVVVWRGLVVASAPPDADHPYGHGKAEPLAAATVSAFLLVAAIGIAVKSLSEIMAPHHVPEAFTLLVLLVVVPIKEALFRFVLREARSVESSAVRSDAWHHRSDAITSLAAAIGISIALLGGPRYAAADDYAALAAAAIIAWNGWRLLGPAMSELMDTSPGAAVTNEILGTARGIPGVQRIEKCIVRKMGYQYFVDMHVEVDPKMSVATAHEIAHQVKDHVRARLPKVRDVLVHIEPFQGLSGTHSASPIP